MMKQQSMVRRLGLVVVAIAGYIAAAQVVLASAPPTAVAAPIWRVGDEWEYAYISGTRRVRSIGARHQGFKTQLFEAEVALFRHQQE